MKILVCGDRRWTNRKLILSTLKAVFAEFSLLRENITIVEGECKGADIIAREICEKNGITVLPYPAQWNDLTYPNAVIKTRIDGSKYDAYAGNRRNMKMLKENPDIELILAFHNNIAASKGTRDMTKRAKEKGIKVRIISE